jgi:hypothetical protein
MDPARQRNGNRRGPTMLAEQAAQLPLTQAEAFGKRVDIAVIQRT